MTTAAIIFVIVVAVFVIWRWLKSSRLEVRPFQPASAEHAPRPPAPSKKVPDTARYADGVDHVKRLCLAYMQGDPLAALKAEAAVLQSHDRGPELARHFEIAFESLALIEKTKNVETLLNRLSVARHNLYQANADAAEVFGTEHCDELIAIVDEAASGRLADLAITKVESFKAKATAAKTEPTRLKNLAAAKDYAAEAARHENISTPDRKRIRESATS